MNIFLQDTQLNLSPYDIEPDFSFGGSRLEKIIVVVPQRLSDDEYDQLFNLLHPDQILVDLVRLNGQKIQASGGQYRGIAC